MPVDAGGEKPARNRRRQHEVVDAQAGVATPSIPKVIPEGVNALARMQRAYGIGPALANQRVKRHFHFRAEQRIVAPALGLVNIQIGRHDVVVASQDDRNIEIQELGGVGLKTLEPPQLVVEFRSGRGIAVG